MRSDADEYAEFAVRQARGSSAAYERLALAVSQDAELLALIEQLPATKTQPNLLFGVVRYLGGQVEDPAAFREFMVKNWPSISAEMLTRSTQTNEAGRCAVLLPVLASLPQPLALLEVGTSAGLCLYPDRYAYKYGDQIVGSGSPLLECSATGVKPTELPTVVWRAGIDLNPLSVSDPADIAWLDALIWPEQTHRRARLHAAAATAAAADPPLLVRGDLVDALPALAAQAPTDATLVVFHTSVLCYLPPARQAAFAQLVTDLPGHWVANDAGDIFPYEGLPPAPSDLLHNVLALDGRPLAWTRPHGQSMTWFG